MSIEHIKISRGIRTGKPHLKGTRITVSDIVIWHLRMGKSLEEIAGEYHLSPASVHAAMAYYFDHRLEIDRSIRAEQALAKKLKAGSRSLLKEKLRAITRG